MFEVNMEDFNRLEARVDQVEEMLRKDKKERQKDFKMVLEEKVRHAN